jgi:probable biosynthetic protein (TIGR04098 family)
MTHITPLSILEEEIPGLSKGDLVTPFDQLAIDSLALVTLRARLESFSGYEASDALWTSATTPADLLEIFSVKKQRVAHVGGEKASRSFNINMPQMAMGGLSESWLFKELGDMHWGMITDGLECPSSQLLDGNGSRLYATFTRITVSVDALSSYNENSLLSLDGHISRFGSGMFFSDIKITNGHAQLMSSFSMRAEGGSNVALLKGQPKIPQHCKIAEHPGLPPFAVDYRANRASVSPGAIFSCEYAIIPQHDINGVGLLYFAAYPIIADICEARYKPQPRLSTIKRDVFYFSNCEPNETLVFHLHKQHVDGVLQHSEATLSRKSDGALMARMYTTREVFPIARILRAQRDYVKTWKGARLTPQSFIVTLNESGSRQGLFWCLQGYQELTQLAQHLGPDQPVHGMRSGHLIMDYSDLNLDAIASYYASEMIALQPDGPLVLGGNCQGGVIARAIALRLQTLGRQVTLLILMEQQSFIAYGTAPVALIFGRGSHFNPYQPGADPEAVFRAAYPQGFTVDIIPGAHGEFFESPNVEALCRAVQQRLLRQGLR